MKNLYRSLVLTFILVFGFSEADADPYICSPIGAQFCNYKSISGPIYLCTGEAVDLYARQDVFINPPPSCGSPTYQWYRYGVLGGNYVPLILYGQTENKITVNIEGEYECRVTCSGDDYTTSAAQIYISIDTPVVTTDPAPEIKCLEELANFSILASGDDKKYQWQVKEFQGSWADIAGASSSSLEFFPVKTEDQNQYRCEVSNGCNLDLSNPATLTVNAPPVVVIDPLNDSVCNSSAAGFSITTSGDGLVYVWQELISDTSSWADLSSAGNYDYDQAGNLTVNGAGSDMDGFRYRAVISGICAPGDTSLAGSIFIKPAPGIIVQPADDTVCAGENAHFLVSATGTDPIQYKWIKGGKTVQDWNNSSFLDLVEVGLVDNEAVQVLISDACFDINNPISSDEAKLVVNRLPSVTLGDNRPICTGSSTVLDPGNHYNAYNWSTGDTTQSIAVNEESLYKVTVSDQKGCEAEAAVFIILDPVIAQVQLGIDSGYCSGDEVILDAGTGYDNYNWSDGSNGQSLDIVTSGNYWVTTSNNNTVCESTDTVSIVISEPYSEHNICLITIDQATGKYLVIWERAIDAGIQEYNIYREESWIGSVSQDGLSIFIDNEADPEKRPYQYTMTVTDTCGNESVHSTSHIPIFLQYTGYIDGINLSWSQYQVKGSEVDFDSYSVYKGRDSTLLAAIEESIPTAVSVYIDNDPLAIENQYFYRVAGILTNPCFPSGGSKKEAMEPFVSSLSNMDQNIVSGTGSLESIKPLLIYPNPATDYATLRFKNDANSDYSLMISDLSGQIVRVVQDISGNEFTVNTKNLSPGYYQLKLAGDQVYHGTMIVR